MTPQTRTYEQQQAQHEKRKISAVCSLWAYNWLFDWIKQKHKSFPYPMPPDKYFYSNTAHREYLSMFIESVIVFLLREYGCDPVKAKDKGRSIDKSIQFTDVIGRTRTIGGRVFVRDKDVKKGRADIKCYIGRGKKRGMYNFEVKALKDRQSEDQKIEQQRAEVNGEHYVIIHTVDEFLRFYEEMI